MGNIGFFIACRLIVVFNWALLMKDKYVTDKYKQKNRLNQEAFLPWIEKKRSSFFCFFFFLSVP